jgi:hypothetical protein
MRFRPEVPRVSWRAAEFQRDQVVFFVVAEAPVGVAVFLDLPTLQLFGIALRVERAVGRIVLEDRGLLGAIRRQD